MTPQIHVTKETPLAIADIALTTALANGWEETAAAIRAGYDAFEVPDYSDITVAPVPALPNITGVSRLTSLLTMAKKQLTKEYGKLPTLIAFIGNEEEGVPSKTIDKELNEFIEQTPLFADAVDFTHFEGVQQERCSLAIQLNRAREVLDTTDHKQVMILAVDSYLFIQRLLAFASEYSTDYKKRLFIDSNMFNDGFIPSEAAGVLIVEKGETSSSPYLIDGIGLAFEPATLSSKEPNNGDGLADAINQACDNANASFSDYGWRIASISGEEYFFKEASMAQIRCAHKKTDNQPLWTPASHIGETGCVIGMTMIATAINSFIKNYNIGSRVMCHMSNDNSLRAAFSFTYRASQ